MDVGLKLEFGLDNEEGVFTFVVREDDPMDFLMEILELYRLLSDCSAAFLSWVIDRSLMFAMDLVSRRMGAVYPGRRWVSSLPPLRS